MNWLVLGTALWLGLLTAISPCPLASNVAAVSFIGREAGDRSRVLLSGVLYALGRTFTYVAVALVITAGILAAADLSRFLQRYMNQLLGPVLILLGMVLLGWIGSGLSWGVAGGKVQARAAKGGMVWAFPLGVVFALSFCPVSAGLYFAGLVPLSVRMESPFLLPALYGVGTALPVVVFAGLIAFAAERVGKVFDRVTQVERWVRGTAGTLFILAGVYYSVVHVYGW